LQTQAGIVTEVLHAFLYVNPLKIYLDGTVPVLPAVFEWHQTLLLTNYRHSILI